MTYIKPAPEQLETLNGVAKHTEMHIDDITYWVVEMGIATLIGVRKEKGLDAFLGLQEMVVESEELTLVSQALEMFWNKGQEKPAPKDDD